MIRKLSITILPMRRAFFRKIFTEKLWYIKQIKGIWLSQEYNWIAEILTYPTVLFFCSNSSNKLPLRRIWRLDFSLRSATPVANRTLFASLRFNGAFRFFMFLIRLFLIFLTVSILKINNPFPFDFCTVGNHTQFLKNNIYSLKFT